MTSVLERGERMDTNDAHMATYIDEWDVTDVSSGYRAIGVVKKEFADYNPTKSDIIPTIIHDKIREHVTEPAILTVRDPRNTKGIDPFENAMSKYCVRTLPLPVKSRELAEEWLIADVIDSFTPSMDVRVMTEDLAINATTWSEGYEPLLLEAAQYTKYVGFYTQELRKKHGIGRSDPVLPRLQCGIHFYCWRAGILRKSRTDKFTESLPIVPRRTQTVRRWL